MSGEPLKGAGLQHARAIWRRRKWLAILVFAAPFAASLGLVTPLPNIYQATATVLVERQQVPEAFVKATVTSDVETRLKTISQEILSRSRLEGLIGRFGLYQSLKREMSPEALIERMRKDIDLEFKGNDPRRGLDPRRGGDDTVAFAISYRGSDPQIVAQVANALASFYIEENLKVRERQAAGTSEFLKAQLEETKQQLDEQERRLSAYKKRFLGELPQQMTGNLAQLEQLTAQLRFNNDKQTRVLWLRDALTTQLADARRAVPSADPAAPETGAAPETARRPDSRPDSTGPRLTRLREELTELRTRYTDKYPEVARLKAEIATLEREAAERQAELEKAELEEEASAPPPKAQPAPRPRPGPLDPTVSRLTANIAELSADIKALQDEEKRLRAAIAVYQARVENTPKREQEIEELSRGYQITKEHYHSLLKRYEEAQLARGMEQRQKGEQFRLLDPALAPEKPAAPNRQKLLLMGLALSLALAGGAVMLAEQLDTSLHSVGELRALTAVPVLVTIPRIVTAADARSRRLRFGLAAGAAVLGLVLLVGATAFVARDNQRLVWILSRGQS
jgi:polysaccharide chain length determinant protein (PEP-CTERM system associated)